MSNRSKNEPMPAMTVAARCVGIGGRRFSRAAMETIGRLYFSGAKYPPELSTVRPRSRVLISTLRQLPSRVVLVDV